MTKMHEGTKNPCEMKSLMQFPAAPFKPVLGSCCLWVVYYRIKSLGRSESQFGGRRDQAEQRRTCMLIQHTNLDCTKQEEILKKEKIPIVVQQLLLCKAVVDPSANGITPNFAKM
jgi:hypothetical protein